MARRDRPGVGAWLELAGADLRLASLAMPESDRDASVAALACFHGHQVAEKGLKALLCANEFAVPYTHDLVQVATSVARAHPLPDNILRACAVLSDRNPGPLRSEAVNLSIPASEFVVFSLGPKTA